MTVVAKNLPDPECPVLIGWDQIGGYMSVTAETARARAKRDKLPVFRPLGWNKPIAIKSELNAALIEIANHAKTRPRD